MKTGNVIDILWMRNRYIIMLFLQNSIGSVYIKRRSRENTIRSRSIKHAAQYGRFIF